MTGTEDARLLEPMEVVNLLGQSLIVVSVGLDAVVFEDDQGELLFVAPCFQCQGDQSHLNFARGVEGLTPDTDADTT